jgi:hypothetical protein
LHGGKYFWIHNTGPLGCLPYALVHRPDLAVVKDAAGCSVDYNKVAQLFNLRLKETVASLRKMHPDATFTYVDVYSAKYKLISEAKKLGNKPPRHRPWLIKQNEFMAYMKIDSCGAHVPWCCLERRLRRPSADLLRARWP